VPNARQLELPWQVKKWRQKYTPDVFGRTQDGTVLLDLRGLGKARGPRGPAVGVGTTCALGDGTIDPHRETY